MCALGDRLSIENRDGGIRILDERERQQRIEQWSQAHDDHHTRGELAVAAACYAVDGIDGVKIEYARSSDWQRGWPWHYETDKRRKHGRIRQLEIAGALIAAEIDRLLRLEKRKEHEVQKEG